MLKALSQSQRILLLLQDGAIHTVPDILRRCYNMHQASSARVGARIYDLKNQGWHIDTFHIKGTTWAYQLIIKTKFKKRK